MNIRLTYLTILVLLLAAMVRGQSSVDSVFHLVDSLYTSGAFPQAELESRRLLESEILSDSISLVAEQWVAFALVAQGEPALAREHFTRILRKRPGYQLDPKLTSPKIITVLDETRSAFLAAEPRKVDPGAVPEIASPRGITFRTILFPGWEQLYHRRTTVGTVFLGAGIATLGAGVVLDFVRRSAREDYRAATTPEDIESKYQTYNRASKREGWAFAAFAAVYVLSEIDVFLQDSPVSLSLQPAGPGNPSLLFAFSLR
jgi:hypothetical protein